MSKNYYMILGVAADATSEEVKAAFRRRALDLHPDHSGKESGPFLELQEAYGVLGDPERRRRYDRTARWPATRRRPWGPAPEPLFTQRPPVEPLRPRESEAAAHTFSLMDAFEHYAPSFQELMDRVLGNFESRSRPKAEEIKSLTVEVVLSPGEARFGGNISLEIPARATCPNCGGHGAVESYGCWQCAGRGVLNFEYPVEITHPAGLRDGHIVRLALDRFGIENFYLTVIFRVSAEVG